MTDIKQKIARNTIIWSFGIFMTLVLGSKYPRYVWEVVELWIVLVSILGFLLLVAGNIIYNRIIIIPCLPNAAVSESNCYELIEA